MKKLFVKDAYETPVVMEISPVTFVAVKGESGGEGEFGGTGMTDGDDDFEE